MSAQPALAANCHDSKVPEPTVNFSKARFAHLQLENWLRSEDALYRPAQLIEEETSRQGREILRLYGEGDPRRLRRLHGRFRAMVLPGTEIRLEHAGGGDGVVRFTVRNHRGEPAIDQGIAVGEW